MFGAIVLALVIVVWQFLYPTDKLLPLTSVEGVSLSGWSKKDAVARLDTLYKENKVAIYFSDAKTAYKSPLPAEIGLSVKNKDRVQAMDYPWYLRTIPLSVLWAHLFQSKAQPTYERNSVVLASYITKQFGESCDVAPVNAQVKVDKEALITVPAISGGTCDMASVKELLGGVQPNLTLATKVAITGKEVPAPVTDAMAKEFSKTLASKLSREVVVAVGTTDVTIPKLTLYSWLDITTTNNAFTYTLNADRASTYLSETIGPKVAVAPGTSKVSTYDFVETSRVNGASGAALDAAQTLARIQTALDDGTYKASAVVKSVAPKVSYTRSYSQTDTGFTALLQNFATSHSGTFGIAFTELTGAMRHARYQGDTTFTTASTYKLFVAYSTLLRVESSAWQWSDQIVGGHDLSACFNRMIRLSDNACAEALLTKIGYQAITNEARAIGATSTSFLGREGTGIKSTAADEALLLAALYKGQILTQQTNRDLWINTMKQNVFRQGIPKGVPSAVVAGKVGFLDALLHDSAIVYSPSGTYVLVILTNNSSWAAIADLASQIEALRTQ
jgi:beta-lactamase class A